MSTQYNSSFELAGPVAEQGRLGAAWSNPSAATATVGGGGSCTFRNRFPSTPSTITFSTNFYTVVSTEPTLVAASRDGFGFIGTRSLVAGQYCYWMGTYFATA